MRGIFAIVLTAFVLAFAGAPALAQEKSEKDRYQTKRTHSLRANVYEKLEKAQEAQSANKLSEALGILQGMLGDDLSEYEQAMCWNLIGSIRYEQDNVPGAIEAFRNVVRLQDIPEGMRSAVMYGLAQLHFAAEQYSQALKVLDDWFRITKEPSGDAYALKAQAHYQLEQYRQSIPPLLTALEIARQQKKRFKESWLGLLRAAYYEIGDYDNAAKILEVLLAMYPKKTYWKQLAGLYGMLNREKDQLATMEAAWDQGLLDVEKEITNLAQLYMYHEVPWKAAKVLERGMKAKIVPENYKNLRLYAQALALAQEGEKQIPVMQQAAKVAPDGEMNVYLAQAYMESGEWSKAARSLGEALRKGVKNPGNVRMMLGIARFNAEDLDGAEEAFRAAAKSKDERETAQQWLKHVVAERDRKKALAAYKEAE